MVFLIRIRAATKQDGGLPLLTFKVVERNEKKIWLEPVEKTKRKWRQLCV